MISIFFSVKKIATFAFFVLILQHATSPLYGITTQYDNNKEQVKVTLEKRDIKTIKTAAGILLIAVGCISMRGGIVMALFPGLALVLAGIAVIAGKQKTLNAYHKISQVTKTGIDQIINQFSEEEAIADPQAS